MTKKFYIVIYDNTEYKEGKGLIRYKIPKRIFCCRFSKRLQVQERLTAVRGLFRESPVTRSQVISLIKKIR